MENIKFVNGGSVTSPAGFCASGITCGLKRSGNPDLAMVFSKVPANFAGAFTSCRFAAAPVILDRERVLKQDKIQAVVVNSGIANACTGQPGYEDAVKMCEIAADALKIAPEAVLVSSTGRIGSRLPMVTVDKGIRLAAAALRPDGGQEAAVAIMTTDTRPKARAVTLEVDGRTITIGGMTKGAGMISPKMTVPHATMLCYITTDAALDNAVLAKMIGAGVDVSFNRINIDGDMSTNDTVIIMANGVSGVKIVADTPAAELFYQAMVKVMQELAMEMVRDGEGASKFVTLDIRNAATPEDARKCAEAISNSLLCKTAWFGCDPNWGRVIAAIGYSGAIFTPEKVKLDYNDLPVVRNGMDAGTPESVLAEILKKGEFTIKVDLGAGTCDWKMWTSDITYEYVKINAEYHT